jgi:protein-tyrosine phosphatase
MTAREGHRVSLDAETRLLYLTRMADFYNPFTSIIVDQRDRRPEVSEILPALFVGEYPRVEDIAWLKKEFRISAVFSLQDDEDLEAKGLALHTLKTECGLHQVEFRRAPVADFNCESLAVALPSALRELDALAQEAHTTFLHCNAGCNRAPTLAIAYLHTYHNMTLAEARDYFKARRPCGPYMEVLYQHFGRVASNIS